MKVKSGIIWSLLLAWVPIIGDPITLAAGVLRTRFLPFLLLVAIGGTSRRNTGGMLAV